MSLTQDLKNEPIRNLSLRDAVAIRSTTTLGEAVVAMRDKHLGCAVIVDDAHRPTGMFTERGLVHALVVGADLDAGMARDYAETKCPTVNQSEPITRVWELIQRDGFRFVAVTDDNGTLVGLTGQRGLAEYLFEYFPQQVAVQRLGNAPWLHAREGA